MQRNRSVTSVFPPPTLPTNHDLLLRRVTVRSYTLRLSLRASIVSSRVSRVCVVFLIKVAQNIEHVATCQESLSYMPRTTCNVRACGARRRRHTVPEACGAHSFGHGMSHERFTNDLVRGRV